MVHELVLVFRPRWFSVVLVATEDGVVVPVVVEMVGS